jgi:hypothetical protein
VIPALKGLPIIKEAEEKAYCWKGGGEWARPFMELTLGPHKVMVFCEIEMEEGILDGRERCRGRRTEWKCSG